AVRAQVLLSESFDGSTFPPSGWTVTGTGINNNSGINTWRQTGGGGFGNVPSPSTHSGAGMAGYECYWTDAGSSTELVSPSLNFSAVGTKFVSFWVYQIQDFV